MTKFTIVAFSDFVCPFCYLGKLRLERAMAQYRRDTPSAADDTFSVHWNAYYLDPMAEPESELALDAAVRRHGAEGVEELRTEMVQLFAAEGKDFTFRGRMGRTRDSHRVVQLAKTKGGDMENSVVGALMGLFFQDGGDITARDDLVSAAEKGGLDAAETRRWLDEGKGGDAVDRQVDQAYRLGIAGVPKFIVNDRYAIDGAADLSEFLQVIKRAAAAAA